MALGVYTMVHFGIATGYTDRRIEVLTEYFVCEAFGHVPGKCDRNVLEQYSYQTYMSAIAYVLLAFIPFTVLNFIVNWEKLFKTLKKQFLLLCKHRCSFKMLTPSTTKVLQKKQVSSNLSSNENQNPTSFSNITSV